MDISNKSNCTVYRQSFIYKLLTCLSEADFCEPCLSEIIIRTSCVLFKAALGSYNLNLPNYLKPSSGNEFPCFLCFKYSDYVLY